jgi:hypothetical protein
MWSYLMFSAATSAYPYSLPDECGCMEKNGELTDKAFKINMPQGA